jgi:hypothetical protein
MQPSLTLQEEELARSLKQQGKTTQEIMGVLAQARTAKITPPRETVSASNGNKFFNKEAAAATFLRAGEDVALAQQNQVDKGYTLGSAARTGATMLLQGGTAPFRAVGEGLFGSDTGQKAVGSVVEQLTKLGDAITPEAVKDTVGKVAMDVIEGYESMSPQEQLNQRNALISAELLSYFVGGKGVNDAVLAPALRASDNVVGNLASETNRLSGLAQDIGNRTGLRPRPSEPIVAPLPPEVQSTIVKTFDTAIKPNLASKQTPAQRAQYEAQVSQAVESITNNVENLRLIDEATGETISKLPENLKEFVDALEQTKQSIFKQYDDLATRAGQSGAQIDTIRVANELDAILNSRALKLSNPESIRYAQDVRDRLLSTKALSAIDAQDVIRNYNNSLDAFYRNPTPEGLSRNAVDALVANQLRQALDAEIDALTGANYQGLKREYGALKAVERDIMRAYNRDARRNQKGLIDFTDVLTGGQVVSGILSMNPAAIGQGIAGKAIAGAIKMINDPNRKVRQIFQEAGRFRRPDTGMQMPTRRQLPPARPDAPRSEVGSGAPVVAGGQTPAGRVDVGGTERVRDGAVRQPAQTGTLRKQAERFKSVDSFVKAVKNNPAWLKKFEEAGVTPEQIGKMVIGGSTALGLVYLLDNEELSGTGFMVMGSILGGMPARKTFTKQLAKKANEGDLLEMSQFTGAFNEGAFKTNNKGELQVVATKNFTQPEAQQALNDALRRAEDFPVVSNATLKELSDVFEDVLSESGKAKGATPPTTLLEEAKKYKSAEEFVEAQGTPKYQHRMLRETAEQDIEAIKKEGFYPQHIEDATRERKPFESKFSLRPNAARIGDTSQFNKTKKGEIVVLLPEEALMDGGNGVFVKPGFKPNDSQIVRITKDGQSPLDAQRAQLTDIWKQANE